MALPPRPVGRQVAVFCACFATFAFVLSAQLDSRLRWLALVVGLLLLAAAILAQTAVRRGAPERGWLPSRDEDGPRAP